MDKINEQIAGVHINEAVKTPLAIILMDSREGYQSATHTHQFNAAVHDIQDGQPAHRRRRI